MEVLWGLFGFKQNSEEHSGLRIISVFCAFSSVLQSGKLSKELDFVSHHVRTKLDELKRQEVSRLRMLLKAKMDATMEQGERRGEGEMAGGVTSDNLNLQVQNGPVFFIPRWPDRSPDFTEAI